SPAARSKLTPEPAIASVVLVPRAVVGDHVRPPSRLHRYVIPAAPTVPPVSTSTTTSKSSRGSVAAVVVTTLVPVTPVVSSVPYAPATVCPVRTTTTGRP